MVNFRLFFPLTLIAILFSSSVSASTAIVAQFSQQSSWEDIWRRIIGRREQDPPLGSRGNVCLISPTLTRQVSLPILWRKKPLFVWQGQVGRVEVYDRETQELMWRQLTPVIGQQVEYQGKPLQAGKVYELQTFTAPRSQQAQRQIPFQITAEQQREQIDRDLTELEKRTDSTPISLTMQRADYWMANGLWEEAIAEIYQAKNPSTKLRQLQREITLQTCTRRKGVLQTSQAGNRPA